VIAAVIVERDPLAARRRLLGVEGRAGIVELRLDALEDPRAALEDLLRPPRPAVIATNRGAADRGGFRGPQRERLDVLRAALDLGAEYADVELAAFDDLAPGLDRARLIASHHDYEGTPDDLESWVARLAGTGAAVLKIATTARRFADNLSLLRLPRRAPRPLIALCMGERGVVSRLLAPKFGSWLTFGAAVAGAESAPGQLTLDAMAERFDLARMTDRTAVFGILGRRIGYSLSPVVHNRVFRELGQDRVYVAFDLDEPEELLASAGEIGLGGLSVTIPHKERLASAPDVLDEPAREIGAVNTLVFDGSKIAGANTDGPAVRRLLDRVAGDGTREHRILVLGSGGVARAIAWAACRKGIGGFLASRSAGHGREIAARFGLDWVAWEDRQDVEPTIVCNATPIGSSSSPAETPYRVSRSSGVRAVFDSVYVPHETRFLAEGTRAGARAIHGIELFLEQAALQARLFTGRRDLADTFARIAREIVGDAGEGRSR